MESVEHGVVSAFAFVTGDDYYYLKNSIDKNFKELDIDSLDIVEACIEIEYNFNMREIQDSEIENFKTIRDVIDFVEKHR